MQRVRRWGFFSAQEGSKVKLVYLSPSFAMPDQHGVFAFRQLKRTVCSFFSCTNFRVKLLLNGSIRLFLQASDAIVL